MAVRPSSIIDPVTNKPFMIADFDREIGGPTVSGVRRHPGVELMRGITPQRLASILYQVKAGVPQHYFELAEEMEERDPHYTSVLGTRKRAVSQLAVKVEAASDSPKDVEIADAFRQWTRRRRLQAELFDVLDAIGKGMSCSEILWDKSTTPWMPARLVLRPMSWFQFDPIERETPRLRVDGNPRGEELAPGKWIVHRHTAKSGLSVRSGIAYIVAWTVMFTHFSVADWIAFADTYGQPFRLGKYPPGTDSGAKAILFDAVSAMGADAAAIVPNTMTVDIVQAAKSDGAMFGALASYFNRLKSKLVLGQEATTEAIAGGHAVSKEQNEVRGDIRDDDAALLSATLQEQLVDVWTRVNYGPGVASPVVSLDYEENEDVKATFDGAMQLADRGVAIDAEELRNKLKLKKPEDGAELVGRGGGAGGAPEDAEGDEPGSGKPPRPRPRLVASNVSRVEIRTALNAASQARRAQEVQDEMLAALEKAGQPIVDGWIEKLTTAVNSGSSLEDIARRLMDPTPSSRSTRSPPLWARRWRWRMLQGEISMADQANDFRPYRRRQIAELRPYREGEVLDARISISAVDRDAGSPKLGDMIARNPRNHDDQWLVAAAYFADNFEPA
jgi:phage gp29-like protein